jgi:hypothetical protein
MNKLKFAILIIVLAALVVGFVVQNQAQVRLRQENESLRQQLDELARLRSDNEQLSNRLAQADAAANAQTTELLKLRNEVGMLRKQSSQIAELQNRNQQLDAALTSSRSAQAAQAAAIAVAKTNVPAAVANAPNLGAIQLVNQTPSRFDLGGGRTCTLIPTIDTDGNYDIKVVFKSKQAEGQMTTATGEITTAPGRAVVLTVDDRDSIAFTPTVNPAP